MSNVFVSYTVRDGEVDMVLLNALHNNLNEVCNPFLDLVNRQTRKVTQKTIILEIFRSHLLLVIESKDVYKSPWVKFEIFLSRLLLIPIIKIKASTLKEYLNLKESY